MDKNERINLISRKVMTRKRVFSVGKNELSNSQKKEILHIYRQGELGMKPIVKMFGVNHRAIKAIVGVGFGKDRA